MIEIADANTTAGSASATKRQRSRRRHSPEQTFASYLSFNLPATVSLSLFLFIYATVLLFAAPLLDQPSPVLSPHNLTRGQVLQPVVHHFGETMKHLPQVALPAVAAGALQLQQQFRTFRRQQKLDGTDLVDEAAAAAHELRKARDEASVAAANLERWAEAAAAHQAPIPEGQRVGVVVLGMHRSGTSMLAGLLVTGMGYNVGGPLIGSKFDNEKGFFERIDVVLQNDEFMNLQGIDWSIGVVNYDDQRALEAKKSGLAKFTYGRRGLAFLNKADNAPWLQKDPRMCITLKTWLPLLHSQPAILFTYRHPLEVALSLMVRESSFSLEHGLRLWIIYNMRGIQNSAGLCRVYSSNDAVLADPMTEVKRISQELTSRCGVPAPPNELSEEQVGKFVDTSLQHNSKRVGDDLPVIDQHGANCLVHELVTTTPVGTPQYEVEHDRYLKAMKIYCDMGSGLAYQDDYEWPTLQ